MDSSGTACAPVPRSRQAPARWLGVWCLAPPRVALKHGRAAFGQARLWRATTGPVRGVDLEVVQRKAEADSQHNLRQHATRMTPRWRRVFAALLPAPKFEPDPLIPEFFESVAVLLNFSCSTSECTRRVSTRRPNFDISQPRLKHNSGYSALTHTRHHNRRIPAVPGSARGGFLNVGVISSRVARRATERFTMQNMHSAIARAALGSPPSASSTRPNVTSESNNDVTAPSFASRAKMSLREGQGGEGATALGAP